MDSIHELKQMNTYLFNRAVFFSLFFGFRLSPLQTGAGPVSLQRGLSLYQGSRGKKISDPCFFLGYDPDS